MFRVTKHTERKLVLLANILLLLFLKYVFFSNYINTFYDYSLFLTLYKWIHLNLNGDEADYKNT